MSIKAYEHNVALMLDIWLTQLQSSSNLAQLASILGCRHVVIEKYRSFEVIDAKDITEPSEEYESIALKALLSMLDAFDPESLMAESIGPVIMDGLLKNCRWKVCLSTEQGAYAFAALAAHLHERHVAMRSRMSVTRELYRVVMEDLWSVLVEWLDEPGKDGPYDRRSLAAGMFGEAWCALVVDQAETLTPVSTFILSMKPDFVAGLVPEKLYSADQALPVMDFQ
jgi:hypothetical protein